VARVAQVRLRRLVQSEKEQLLARMNVKDAGIEHSWSEHAELRTMLAIKDSETEHLRTQVFNLTKRATG
jgi:hypothetical protein